jgi:hypothetical protein
VTPPRPPYRVIKWGTGAIGAEMIIAILDHRADLDLVGVKVYSETKHGKDVGTLVGRSPIGVLATADTAEVIAMPADCVLYTPRTTDLAEVCRILASGKNVATTAFLFHPRRLPSPDRDHVLRAGTTAGQRSNWVGRRNGEPLMQIETLWTVGGEYPDHWPRPKDGWTLTIEGDPSMRTHFFSSASFTRPASIEEHVRSANVATAMQVLNAVPTVCDAAPGLATMAALPLVRSHTGFRNA